MLHTCYLCFVSHLKVFNFINVSIDDDEDFHTYRRNSNYGNCIVIAFYFETKYGLKGSAETFANHVLVSFYCIYSGTVHKLFVNLNGSKR